MKYSRCSSNSDEDATPTGLGASRESSALLCLLLEREMSRATSRLIPCAIHVLPVTSSTRVYCFHFALGVGCAGFYIWLAVFPPLWAPQVCKQMCFPTWMEHVFAGICAIVVLLILADEFAARAVLFHEDLSNLFEDDEAYQEVSCRILNPREQRITALQRTLVLPMALLGLLYVLCVFPHGFAIMLFLIPLTVLHFRYAGAHRTIFEALLYYTEARAEHMCRQLELGRYDAEQIPLPLEILFWQRFTDQHRDMDQSFEIAWSWWNGGRLLVTDMSLRVCGVVVFLIGVVGSDDKVVMAGCVVAASFVALTVLGTLYPLAKVTSLCQSHAAGDRSILRLTLQYVNHRRMSAEAKAEQSRFLQYICNTPVGIEVPVVGLVTTHMIANYAKAIGTLAPITLTYILRMLGKA